jgi:Xaa-Pro aminopeptidase
LPDEKYLKDKVLDRETLYEILAESRVIKNDEEILALRWASQITAEAHCEVLRKVKENMRESQVESHFNFFGGVYPVGLQNSEFFLITSTNTFLNYIWDVHQSSPTYLFESYYQFEFNLDM